MKHAGHFPSYELSSHPFCPCDSVVFVIKDGVCPFNDYFSEDNWTCGDTIETKGSEAQQVLDYSFLKKPSHTVRVFSIHCEETCHALFMMDSGVGVNVWVNGILKGLSRGSQRMMILSMNRGENTVGLETESTTPETEIFLRINQYEAEKEIFPSPVADCFTFSGSLGYLNHKGQHLYHNEPFCFSFFPNNDLYGEEQTVDFRLYNGFTKETLYSKQYAVRQAHQVDLSPYEIDGYDEGNGIVAEIKYRYLNGAIYSTVLPLYTKPVDERLKNICRRAERIEKQYALTDYDRLAIRFGVEYITKYGRELAPILSQASLLRGTLDRIEDKGHADNNFYLPGDRRIFFYNELYDAVNYYRVLVPEHYDSDRKYPLLVIFSTHEYGAWCRNFKRYTSEPMIVADISGRGVLLGSYMGDASIQIALSDLFSKYSIDRSRVYCTGNSNGAGTAWAQTEAYPDVYAGIYAVSGQPNYELLTNLDHQKIITLSSDADDMNNIFKETDKRLQGHKDYTPIEAEFYSHQALHLIWFNNQIFDRLLSGRLDPYPTHVRFRTYSNRHRKSFWVEIHSLAAGSKDGAIEAKIVGTDIYVQCSGITGFTLTIPPILHTKHVSVYVNGIFSDSFEGVAKEKVYFLEREAYEENQVKYQRRDSILPIRNLHQGYGLLDVYLDPVTIVIPNECSKEIADTANAYSTPHCNGFIPRIYVSYPIITFDRAEQSDTIRESKSMIVIDDFSENSAFVSTLRENAPIKAKKNGWTYKEKTHEEHYCLQQIFENPWNPSRSVLLISTNDTALLRKNLFTRKIIVPTYANGYHGYWNVDALIFNGGYQTVFDTRVSEITKL